MKKQCLFCKKEFHKKPTQSLNTWNNVVKYCSRECLGHATGKERFITLNKSRIGKKLSSSHIDKLKIKRIGRTPALGMTHNTETRNRIKQAILKAQTLDVRLKKSLSHRGELNYNWKGGRTGLKHQLRTSYLYRQWRSDIFTRDNFTCVWCGDNKGGNLEADHIEQLKDILDTYNILTLEQAYNCPQLWNINNGRTLCETCHIIRHKKQ